MAAEDALLAELESLESSKGPQKMTCLWWQDQPPEIQAATARAVQRVGHTGVARLLKAKGFRVTPPDIKAHANGSCACQTSQTS